MNSDRVVLADAPLEQIDTLLAKHGKRIPGPKEVKTAWLPIILTNSLRASVGEIMPTSVLTLSIEELNQIDAPKWLVKLRRARVHEEDIERLLRLNIADMDQMGNLADDVMRDAGIGLEARRAIKKISGSSRSSSSQHTDVPIEIISDTANPVDQLSSLSPNSDYQVAIRGVLSRNGRLANGRPSATSRSPGRPGNGRLRPVPDEAVENVLRFMINQVNLLEAQEPGTLENVQHYVRRLLPLLLQLLSGQLPFFRVLSIVGNIWNLLNQPIEYRR